MSKQFRRDPRCYMAPTVAEEWDWGGEINYDLLISQETNACRNICQKLLNMGISDFCLWEKQRKSECFAGGMMDVGQVRQAIYRPVLEANASLVWSRLLESSESWQAIANKGLQELAPASQPARRAKDQSGAEPSSGAASEPEEADEPIVVDAQRLAEDIRWVYANLEKKSLRPTSAPTPGAYSMWRMAQQDHRWFVDKMLPKALPSKIEEASSAVEVEDSMRQEALIHEAKRVLSQASDVYAG